MALDRNPTINVPSLTNAAVLGSGKYSLSEMEEYTRLRLQALVTERDFAYGVRAFFAATVTDSIGDTAQEIASFDEGVKIAGRRLMRDYKSMMFATIPTLQDVRNTSLTQLIAAFDSRDTNADGKLNKIETGLHDRLFTDLDVDADGFVTKADLAKGIKV